MWLVRIAFEPISSVFTVEHIKVVKHCGAESELLVGNCRHIIALILVESVYHIIVHAVFETVGVHSRG